jgi:hypothetical protein
LEDLIRETGFFSQFIVDKTEIAKTIFFSSSGNKKRVLERFFLVEGNFLWFSAFLRIFFPPKMRFTSSQRGYFGQNFDEVLSNVPPFPKKLVRDHTYEAGLQAFDLQTRNENEPSSRSNLVYEVFLERKKQCSRHSASRVQELA